MNGIEQSPFLLALGYAIGHSIWQLSVLWFIYFVLNYFGNFSSHRRFAWSAFLAIGGLVWFLATLVYYINHLREVNVSTNFSSLLTLESTGNGLTFFYQTLLATLSGLSPYLSCAYLLVVLVLCIRLINGFRQVKKLRSQQITRPSAQWRLFVTNHARLLGIKKNVRVYISGIASSPLTIGFIKPVILLPIASINQLTIHQTEAILLHELAHIRRNDYLLNLLLLLAEICLFFNPFMRLLLKQCRLERENSCDDFVLQFKYCPNDYARALLSMEQQSMRTLLALGSNNQNQFQLLNRIKRLVAPEQQSFNYKQQLGLLAVITVLSVFIAAIRPGQKPKNMAEKEEFANLEIASPIENTKGQKGINLVSALQNNSLNVIAETENSILNKTIQKEKRNTQQKEIESKISEKNTGKLQEIVQESLITKWEMETSPMNNYKEKAGSPAIEFNPSAISEQSLNEKIQKELQTAQLYVAGLPIHILPNELSILERKAPGLFSFDFNDGTLRQASSETRRLARTKPGEKNTRITIRVKPPVNIAMAPVNKKGVRNRIAAIPIPETPDNHLSIALNSEETAWLTPELDTETLKDLEKKLAELELGFIIQFEEKAMQAIQLATEKAMKATNSNFNYQWEMNAREMRQLRDAAKHYAQIIKNKKAIKNNEEWVEQLENNIRFEAESTEKEATKVIYHFKTKTL